MRLTIKTDNAAFEGDNLQIEISRLLHLAAGLIMEGHTDRLLFDLNGNCVGGYDIEKEVKP